MSNEQLHELGRYNYSSMVQWTSVLHLILCLVSGSQSIRQSSMTRARCFPLPDGPGQVKLPVGQVDLNRFYSFLFHISRSKNFKILQVSKWWFWEKASPDDSGSLVFELWLPSCPWHLSRLQLLNKMPCPTAANPPARMPARQFCQTLNLNDWQSEVTMGNFSCRLGRHPKIIITIACKPFTTFTFF